MIYKEVCFDQQNGVLRQAQLKMLDMLKFVDTVCKENSLDYWLEGGTLLGAVRHQGFIPWDDDLDISMPRDSFNSFLNIAPSYLPEHLWIQTRHTDKGYFHPAVPLRIRDNNSRYILKHETGLEPYHQGIYIDIFPYDKQPNNKLKRGLYQFISKKILRLLHHKYAPLYLYRGHYGKMYRLLSQLCPKTWLESALNNLVRRSNQVDSKYIGYGYDCRNPRYYSVEDIYPLKRTTFEDGVFNIPANTDHLLRQQFGDYWKIAPKHKRGFKHCRELIPHVPDIHITRQDIGEIERTGITASNPELVS